MLFNNICKKINNKLKSFFVFIIGKPIEESADIFYFKPLRLAFYLFFIISSIYIAQEELTLCLPNIKDYYLGLKAHPFLTSLSTYFAAVIAILIAWQRSLVSNIQINHQSSSLNMSNFYSISNQIKEDFKKNANKINENQLQLNHDTSIFNFLFKDPKNGNYYPSKKLIELFDINKNLYNELRILTDDFIMLSRDINDEIDEQNISHTGLNSYNSYIYSIYDIYKNSHRKTPIKITKKGGDIQETITKISKNLEAIVESCGLDWINKNEPYRKCCPLISLDIYNSLVSYILELVNVLPINDECKNDFIFSCCFHSRKDEILDFINFNKTEQRKIKHYQAEAI